MSPLLLPGDKVLVRKITPEQVRFGDIVVFWRNGNLIVHRILGTQRTSGRVFFSEKGDREFYSRLIAADTIIGKVTMARRRGFIIDLDTSISRFINTDLSFWIYYTSLIIKKLKCSRYMVIRRIGGAFLRLISLFSYVLTVTCFIVWYPAGLFAMRNGYPDGRYQAI